MDDCCEVREIGGEQRRVLHVVLWINVAMFLVESVSGIVAHSTALLADIAGSAIHVIRGALRADVLPPPTRLELRGHGS